MKLKTVEDIPSSWKRFTARKNTTIKIRPCKGVERFSVSWSDKPLVSDPTTDFIIIQPNGKEYPIKTEIFWDTYSPVSRGAGGAVYHEIWDFEYKKTATTVLVEIPEDVTPFEIETLEGIINNVAHPDYIAIGSQGELYTNTKEFVENNLEILPTDT